MALNWEDVSPQSIAALATFIGNGYAYRYAVRKVRGQRDESEFHTVVTSIVASVYLWALLTCASIGVHHFYKRSWDPSITLSLHLAISFLLGLGWGYLPRAVKTEPGTIVHRMVGGAQSQSIIRFLDETPSKAYVWLQLNDGKWYRGTLYHYDFDPERFKEIHIVLAHVSSLDKGEWVKNEDLENMIVCTADVKVIWRMKPKHLGLSIQPAQSQFGSPN